jgi:hypothetical protein
MICASSIDDKQLTLAIQSLALQCYCKCVDLQNARSPHHAGLRNLENRRLIRKTAWVVRHTRGQDQPVPVPGPPRPIYLHVMISDPCPGRELVSAGRGFIVAQLFGAFAATVLFRWLLLSLASEAKEVVFPRTDAGP